MATHAPSRRWFAAAHVGTKIAGMMRLDNKVALVTGASGGIGAAIARRLAKDGAKVAVNYARNRDAADAVVRDIRTAGGEAIWVQADLSDPSQIARPGTLLAFLGSWNFAVNLAAPFFTVHMLKRMDLSLALVVGLGSGRSLEDGSHCRERAARSLPRDTQRYP